MVTGAALITMAVFSIFATMSLPDHKTGRDDAPGWAGAGLSCAVALALRLWNGEARQLIRDTAPAPVTAS